MTPEEINQANAQLLRAYQLAFGSPAGKSVQADLSAFCFAEQTCAGSFGEKAPIDRDRLLLYEGRRQVWLRIQKFMKLTIDEVTT